MTPERIESEKEQLDDLTPEEESKKKEPIPADELLKIRVFFSEIDLDRAGVMSRKQRERMRKDGRFPDRVQLSRGRYAYRGDLIRRWVANPEGWRA